jgi:hypothetical protein
VLYGCQIKPWFPRTDESIKMGQLIFLKGLFKQQVVIWCENLNWRSTVNAANPRRKAVIRAPMLWKSLSHLICNQSADLRIKGDQVLFLHSTDFLISSTIRQRA